MPPVGDASDSSAEDKDKVAAASAVDTPTDAKPSDASSGAGQDAKEPKAPLDIVRAALKPNETPSGSEENQEGKVADGAKPVGDDVKPDDKKGDAKTAEDDKPPPFHEHPRWKSLTKERDDLAKERDGLKGDAAEYRTISTFMDKNGVTHSQVVDALHLLALLNSDPAKGREAMAKSLADLDARIGETLPDDLKTAVEKGEITEDRAKELSKARAGKTLADEREAARIEQEEADKAARDQASHVAGMQTAVKSWAAVTAKTDRDFAKKTDLIKERVGEILRARGKMLQSAEDAVTVTRTAYEDVNRRINSFVPAKTGREFVKAEGGGTGGDPPAPKTPLEALRGGLARTQA